MKPETNNKPRFGAATPLMIGSSAAGSRLLEQWNSMGWRNWIIVDSVDFTGDHIKKHARPKILRSLREALFRNNEGGVDATREQQKQKAREREDNAGKVDLMVDASGDPRVRGVLAGEHRTRCASMCLTPRGDAGALLLEDLGRRLKLDTLEAQFYRWLMNSDNGWSARSEPPDRAGVVGDCRDDVTGIPPDALAPCADAMGGWLPALIDKPGPAIIAFGHIRDAGNTAAYIVKPLPSEERIRTGWRIVWDMGMEENVLKMRWEALPRETGGVLLGFAEPATKSIFVVDACPPPEDSTWSNALFQRGSRGIEEAVEAARIRTGCKVSYVGEWHSHPDAMFPVAGWKDLHHLAGAGDEMGLTGHPPVLLIIGENDLGIHPLIFQPANR